MLAVLLAVPPQQAPRTSQGQSSAAQEAQRAPTGALVPSPPPDERIARYTFWLTLLTGAMAITALLQWRVSNRQHATMVEQEKLTRRTVEVMDDTKERSLRAYVTVVQSGIRQDEFGNGGSLFVLLRNTGQTPAYRVSSRRGRLEAHGNPLFAPRPDYFEDPPIAVSSTCLGPGSEIRFSVDFTAAEAAEVKAGNLMLCIIGRVEYVDAFGGKRVTNLCHYWRSGRMDVQNLVRYQHMNDAT